MPQILKDCARIDRARITGKIKRCDDGSLQGTATVARSGILTYFENGKIIKEFVPPDELAKQDSLSTLKMRPITNDHPSTREVTPANVKEFQCGMTGETVTCDGQTLDTTLTINESKAIAAVDGGKRELSAGYRCDIEMTAGTYNGERYDRIQRNRHYNHVAICDLGRAGSVASLHLDSADVYEVDCELEEGTSDEVVSRNIEKLVKSGKDKDQAAAIAYKKAGRAKKDSINPSQRSRPMPVPITIKGIVYNDQAPEVAAAIADALATIETVRKDSATALASVQNKLEVETAAHVATKTKLDAANQKIAALPAEIAAAAKARAELVATAKPHLDKAEQDRIDSMSDAEIRLAVAHKAFPAAKDVLAAVKTDNAEAVSTWYNAALATLKNDATNSAAAQNRLDVNGKPRNEAEQPHVDSQEEWEAKQLKNDKKSNREQFLKN